MEYLRPTAGLLEGTVSPALAVDTAGMLAVDTAEMPVDCNSETCHNQFEQYPALEGFPGPKESDPPAAFLAPMEYTLQEWIAYHPSGLPVLA